MAPLGPFEPSPRLAAAVSGGADSMALALLAQRWAAWQGGDLLALVVDHRLRPDSTPEAALTAERLMAIGISARILPLIGLAPGPGLAARAREARYAALEAACTDDGRLHLLLGHHAADQAETVAMRMLGQSGADGLAGMAALVERPGLRWLRPLLAVPPMRLRATLSAAGIGWVEDPSNRNQAARRNRLRLLRGDADGTGPVIRAAAAATALRGMQRSAAESARAAWLARHVAIHPEGYAAIAAGPIDPAAVAALLRCIAGRHFPLPAEQVAAWAAAPRAATLGGCEIRAGGRHCPGGWLVLREAAAMQPPIAALPGAMWDGRFRLLSGAPEGAMLGPLGAAAAHLRRASGLTAAVLRTLPALRLGGTLVAVPHLGYAASHEASHARLVFHPAVPAAGAGFVAMRAQDFG